MFSVLLGGFFCLVSLSLRLEDLVLCLFPFLEQDSLEWYGFHSFSLIRYRGFHLSGWTYVLFEENDLGRG